MRAPCRGGRKAGADEGRGMSATPKDTLPPEQGATGHPLPPCGGEMERGVRLAEPRAATPRTPHPTLPHKGGGLERKPTTTPARIAPLPNLPVFHKLSGRKAVLVGGSQGA